MQNLWKQVADQYCTSAEEVQAEIAEAIRQGMNNPDVDVQQAWAEIPRQQDEPQPEDVVAWIAAQLLAAGILPESAAVSEQPEMAVTVIPKSVHLLRKMCHIPETTQGTVKTVLLHFLEKQFRWERVLLHS